MTAWRRRFSDQHIKVVCVALRYDLSEPDRACDESCCIFGPVQIGFIISLHKWENGQTCAYQNAKTHQLR